jgi:hypothetical protein
MNRSTKPLPLLNAEVPANQAAFPRRVHPAAVGDAPFLDEVAIIRHPHCDVMVLLGQQHGDAGLPQLPMRAPIAWTITGASPSLGSSIITVGAIKALPTASIWRSPPESEPLAERRRFRSCGKSS